jgi:phage pi2 protein 07
LKTIDLVNKYMPKKNNIRFVAFEAKHLDEMQCYGFDNLSDADLAEEKNSIVEQTIDDVAFTILYNNKPVCVFGCVIYWEGVAEVWSLISDDLRKFPVFLTKCGQVWCDICEVLFNLHRVEITVKASDKRATKWAPVLGFKHESLMEKYSAKQENFNLFVRINHER